MCEFTVLSESKHGKVIICEHCTDKVGFEFNNITQSLPHKDFQLLQESIEKVDTVKYFEKYPFQKKIYLKAIFPSLCFVFTESEIVELKKLLSDAIFKLTIYESIKQNIN